MKREESHVSWGVCFTTGHTLVFWTWDSSSALVCFELQVVSRACFSLHTAFLTSFILLRLLCGGTSRWYSSHLLWETSSFPIMWLLGTVTQGLLSTHLHLYLWQADASESPLFHSWAVSTGGVPRYATLPSQSFPTFQSPGTHLLTTDSQTLLCCGSSQLEDIS